MSWLRPSVWMHPLPNFASNLLVREIIEAFLSLSVAMHRRWSSTHERPRLMTEDTRPDAAPQASGTAKQPEGSAVRDRHSDYAPETRGLIETSKQLTQVSLPARVHDIPSHLVNKTCINTRDQHILHCNLSDSIHPES